MSKFLSFVKGKESVGLHGKYGVSTSDDDCNQWWSPRRKDCRKIGDSQEYDQARARSLVSSAIALESAQSEVHEQHLFHGQIYSNRQIAMFDWGTGQFIRKSLKPVSRVAENITATIVDVYHAQIGKNRPKATPMPRGASWKIRQQARKLDKYLWGLTMDTDLYGKAKSGCRTAAIYGFCGLRQEWNAYKNKLTITEVFPDDILIDEAEVSATGDASYMFHRRCLPIATVAAMFNVDVNELHHDPSIINDTLAYRKVGKGWVMVVEGWLKANDGGPGRYVAATSGRLLCDEAWEHQWFPFTFYHYAAPVAGKGFYTPPMVETLLPFQIQHNEISEAIRAGIQNSGTVVMVPIGSSVDPNSLRSRYFKVVKHTPGLPPAVQVVPIGARELIPERYRITQEAFQRVGLSQTSNANLPEGVRYDSSPALREANAMQNDRLVDAAQRYEDFILNTLKLAIKVTKANAEDGTSVFYHSPVKTGNRRMSESITWKEIDLDESSYYLQLEASSAHSMTPAAARQTLEEQLSSGIITPEEYQLNLASPDSESVATLASISARNLEWVVDQLQEGVYIPPEQEQDLVMGVQRVTMSLLDLDKYDDVPEDVRTVHRLWISAAKSIMSRAVDANPMGAPAGEEIPTGAPPAQQPLLAQPMQTGVNPGIIPVQ